LGAIEVVDIVAVCLVLGVVVVVLGVGMGTRGDLLLLLLGAVVQ